MTNSGTSALYLAMESLNLKTFLNEKVKNFVSRKINDKNVSVNIETIKFLKKINFFETMAHAHEICCKRMQYGAWAYNMAKAH